MSEDRIETNPEVMFGKPVIRGTRVTVELLLRKLSEGALSRSIPDNRCASWPTRSSKRPWRDRDGRHPAGSFVIVTPAHIRFRPMPE